ncbi:MAG TPA: hypothetical protein VNJ51_11295 [Candidatus Dormibacteraeota bacterium]|nr:hypothetical protein [Candidatus Dormibacteraeota bacterium]
MTQYTAPPSAEAQVYVPVQDPATTTLSASFETGSQLYADMYEHLHAAYDLLDGDSA